VLGSCRTEQHLYRADLATMIIGGGRAGGNFYAGGVPGSGLASGGSFPVRGGYSSGGAVPGGGAYASGGAVPVGGVYASGGALPVGGAYAGGGAFPVGGAYGRGAIPVGSVTGGQSIHAVGGSDDCCGSSGPVLASRRHGSFVGSGVGSGVGPGSGTILQPNPGCGTGCGSGTSDTGCCVGGPEAACGGVASPCFEGAGTMIGTSDWTYVGQGRGNYNAGGYNYVGEGAGSYTKETIAIPYGCRLRPCCLLLLPLPLLPFLIPYLLRNTTPNPVPIPAPPPPAPIPMPPPAPAPPVAPPPAPPPAVGAFGTCTGWGDPHIRTFDGMRSDYYSSGEYYLVKSNKISIQARYLPTKFTHGLAVTKILAIGGPLLKGNKLLIGPLVATWNGAPILGGFPSHFSKPGVTVDYDNVGALVDTALDPSKKKIVHVKIDDGTPEGLKVQVNRWTASPGNEYVNWKISMHKLPDQDGHCGNFNQNAGDDDRLAVRQRLGTQGVPVGPELLFPMKTPITAAGRPDINNCPTATLNAAKADCKATFGGTSPKMSCLTDYCFAGKEVALNK